MDVINESNNFNQGTKSNIHYRNKLPQLKQQYSKNLYGYIYVHRLVPMKYLHCTRILL